MKYVIEFEDEPNDDGYYKCMDAPWWSASWSIIGKMTPYDEAFAGYQESAYKKGLEDAWEVARRIVACPEQGGLDMSEIKEVFGFNVLDVGDLFATIMAEEAIAKLKAYDEEQDSIKVGDEVVVNGLTGVVMRLDEKGNVDRYFTSDGKTFGNISGFQNNEVRKTGRHFDEVEKLLERMREG